MLAGRREGVLVAVQGHKTSQSVRSAQLEHNCTSDGVISVVRDAVPVQQDAAEPSSVRSPSGRSVRCVKRLA